MKLTDVKGIQYIPPNADLEYEEAQRYDSLRGLSTEQWRELVASGRPVRLGPALLARLGNTTANDVESAKESLNDLEPLKVERTGKAVASGRVEYPIVLKDGDMVDLLAGNTRLTMIVASGLMPEVLVIEAP